jgi:DNA-nicking Smr family endonuclease
MKKKKSKDIFHPAFDGLEKTLKKYPEPATQKQPPLKPQKIEKTPDDENIFTQAMSGVVPLEKKGIRKTPAHEKKIAPPYPAPDVEQEVMDHLRDLVDGTVDMDITFSDEYIEGSISGVDRNTMRRLKRGQLPIQDHIDLHGLTQKEAETRVREFLVNSQARGLQCVLIVHGRGLNSPDNIPILKERLPVWLNKGAARKIVKAFSSARPYDGGTGAIYVLMRRHKAQGTGRRAQDTGN